jgi:hypothetical protein
MPQPKGSVHFFSGATRKFAERNATTAEDDRRNLIHEALRDLAGIEVIYAIRCPDGLIKIGWTADINLRRKPYGADPTIILAVRPGSYDEEQDLHRRLRESCARGREYYHPTDEVLGFVNEIRVSCGVDPIEAAAGSAA